MTRDLYNAANKAAFDTLVAGLPAEEFDALKHGRANLMVRISGRLHGEPTVSYLLTNVTTVSCEKNLLDLGWTQFSITRLYWVSWQKQTIEPCG